MNTRRHIRKIKFIKAVTRLLIISLMIAGLWKVVDTYFGTIVNPFKIEQETLNRISILKSEVNDLKDQKKLADDEYKKISNELAELNAMKEANNEELNNLKNMQLDELKYYMGLYNKYKFALEYKRINPKADFGLPELEYLDTKCKESDPPVPTALMLAEYETESEFNSKEKNSTSTATGYGQLLDGTAKMVYENMLSRGTYDRSQHRYMATNKRLNIDMSVALMSNNLKTYGNARQAVEWYYGHEDPYERQRYISAVNNNLKNYGTDIDDVYNN